MNERGRSARGVETGDNETLRSVLARTISYTQTGHFLKVFAFGCEMSKRRMNASAREVNSTQRQRQTSIEEYRAYRIRGHIWSSTCVGKRRVVRKLQRVVAWVTFLKRGNNNEKKEKKEREKRREERRNGTEQASRQMGHT